MQFPIYDTSLSLKQWHSLRPLSYTQASLVMCSFIFHIYLKTLWKRRVKQGEWLNMRGRGHYWEVAPNHLYLVLLLPKHSIIYKWANLLAFWFPFKWSIHSLSEAYGRLFCPSDFIIWVEYYSFHSDLLFIFLVNCLHRNLSTWYVLKLLRFYFSLFMQPTVDIKTVLSQLIKRLSNYAAFKVCCIGIGRRTGAGPVRYGTISVPYRTDTRYAQAYRSGTRT